MNLHDAKPPHDYKLDQYHSFEIAGVKNMAEEDADTTECYQLSAYDIMNGAHPDFYGVYGHDENSMCMSIEDFDTYDEAALWILARVGDRRTIVDLTTPGSFNINLTR